MNDNQKGELTQKKKNWFVRGLIIALIVFISALIVVAFICDNFNDNLNAEIVVLIALIVVLALSEVFDNFNIGNLLSMSREKKKVEKELVETVEENKALRSELYSIITNSINSNNNNSSNNYNILGFGQEISKYVNHVESADTSEITIKEKEEALGLSNNDNRNYDEWRELRPKIEKYALRQICDKYSIPSFSLREEVKFPYEVVSKDPIMERNVVFDGYYSSQEEDVFIEVKLNNSYINYFTIYHMISKLFHYIRATNKKAKLILLIVELPDDVTKKLQNHSSFNRSVRERLEKDFKPAINNGLLKIDTIIINDADMKNLRNNQYDS